MSWDCQGSRIAVAPRPGPWRSPLRFPRAPKYLHTAPSFPHLADLLIERWVTQTEDFLPDLWPSPVRANSYQRVEASIPLEINCVYVAISHISNFAPLNSESTDLKSSKAHTRGFRISARISTRVLPCTPRSSKMETSSLLVLILDARKTPLKTWVQLQYTSHRYRLCLRNHTDVADRHYKSSIKNTSGITRFIVQYRRWIVLVRWSTAGDLGSIAN